ncbi:protein-tyrosine phosphatase-like protein [Coniochaeta sp. 2T2.1]|nr:protein-tyrosine phosphatase-like protein [Coniochaeta sp. 2T2.1]
MEKHIQRFRRTKKAHPNGQTSTTPVILHQPPSITTTTAPPSLPSLSTTISSTTSPSIPSVPTHPPPRAPGTPPPTTNNTLLPLPQISTKPPRKLSPFRSFHLRPSSHKRARDSPPASLPHSPTAGQQQQSVENSSSSRPRTAHPSGVSRTLISRGLGGGGGDDGGGLTRRVSADGVRGGEDGGQATGERGRREGGKRMPRFLEMGDKDIQEKFNDLVWQERNRLAQASSNPSPSFRWAKVSGPHLRVLDRYMNIQPWQNNRVRLRVPEGRVDYINASPIVLYPTKRVKANGALQPGEGKKENVDEEEEGEVHRYIAMQGPKQNSTGHVWRMVYEQLESPGVIVMLTETHEAGMEKCFQYFPREVGETMVIKGEDFGDGFGGTVTCEGIEETPAGEAIELRRLVMRVRRRKNGLGEKKVGAAIEGIESREKTPEEKGKRGALDMPRDSLESGEMEVEVALDDDKMKSPTADIREGMRNLGGEFEFGSINNDTATPPPQPQEADAKEEDSDVDERTVSHFLFKKWPDFGVPALEDLESFFTLMRLSREKNANPSNPRVVHCSAGVGRSGTFIALEHLVSELKRGLLEDWDEQTTTLPSPDKTDDGGGEMVLDNSGGSEEHDESSGLDGTGGEDGGEDLIFNTVNALREQRRTMVQADAQYLFIYQVLRKLWLEKYGGGGGDAVAASAIGREGSGEPAAKRLEVDPFVG